MGIVKWHFPAKAFDFRGATAFPTYTKVDGTSGVDVGLAFDNVTEQTAFVDFRALNYPGSGSLTALVNWRAGAPSGGGSVPTTGGVTWAISVAAITPNTDSGSVLSKAFAGANTFSDTHLGTTGERSHDVVGTVSTLDSLATDDYVWLKVARLPGDASDTMAGVAILTGLTISYSDT